MTFSSRPRSRRSPAASLSQRYGRRPRLTGFSRVQPFTPISNNGPSGLSGGRRLYGASRRGKASPFPKSRHSVPTPALSRLAGRCAWLACVTRSAKLALSTCHRRVGAAARRSSVEICGKAAPDTPRGNDADRPVRLKALASRRTESGPVMNQRSMSLIALVFLALGGPVAAQVTVPAPSDRGTWANEQAKPAEQAPSVTRQAPALRPPAGPPARADDEFDPPSSPGCQFRENKLELLV